mgnify:CR=1 FL=1
MGGEDKFGTESQFSDTNIFQYFRQHCNIASSSPLWQLLHSYYNPLHIIQMVTGGKKTCLLKKFKLTLKSP